MKITKLQLKQIIKEELESVLSGKNENKYGTITIEAVYGDRPMPEAEIRIDGRYLGKGKITTGVGELLLDSFEGAGNVAVADVEYGRRRHAFRIEKSDVINKNFYKKVDFDPKAPGSWIK